MRFVPPRCPNMQCEQFARPTPQFYRRRGFYYPDCRRTGVQRFLCKACRRTFSRQTFRHDYRDRRPHANRHLFGLLVSGVGYRQSGRILHLNPQTVQSKARKIARSCRRLHENLCQRLPESRWWLLDEEETHEGASVRPLTVPILIDRDTWFVVDTAVGSIRRLAPIGTRRRQRQDYEERRHPREDQSVRCVRAVLETLLRRVPSGPVWLQTDEKLSYARIARTLFGSRLVHETTSSRLLRGTHNPLFPINTTVAMTRDNCGRLRRHSWLVTKCSECLADHLFVFTVYRNYVRRRFNRDAEADTPARLLGLLPRNLRCDEVVAWRQDWGERSVHPMSRSAARTVRDSAAV